MTDKIETTEQPALIEDAWMREVALKQTVKLFVGVGVEGELLPGHVTDFADHLLTWLKGETNAGK